MSEIESFAELSPLVLECGQAMSRGEVIAYPTEGVWGLGADPENVPAIKRLLFMKARPRSKGLILISGELSHFTQLLETLPSATVSAMKESWPGHVTWLVPHQNLVSPWVCGDSTKVAIRVTQHPTVKALSKVFGRAFISTSANPAGEPSALSADEVRGYFRDYPMLYAPGEIGGAVGASKIVDAETGETIRH